MNSYKIDAPEISQKLIIYQINYNYIILNIMFNLV